MLKISKSTLETNRPNTKLTNNRAVPSRNKIEGSGGLDPG